MAISVVRRNIGGDAAGGTITAAFSSNTAGNKIIVVGMSDGGTVATPTDTVGNTYVLKKSGSTGSFSWRMWVVDSCLVSAGTNTVSAGDGFSDSAMCIYEVSGLAATNSFDQFSANAQSSATSLTSNNTPTLSFANQLILGVSSNTHPTSQLPTVGAGFSNLQTVGVAFASMGAEEQIVASTSPIAATFGLAANSDNETTLVFTFSDTAISAGQAAVVGTFAPGRTWINRFARAERNIFSWPFVQGPPQGPWQTGMQTFLPGKTWINRFAKFERQTYLYPPGPQILEKLVDPFTANSLDISKWLEFDNGGASIAYSVAGATMSYPASSTASTDGDITSIAQWSLVGSYGYIKIKAVPSSSTQADGVFRLYIDANNWIRWVVEAGTLYAQYQIAGVTTTAFSVAYDPATHIYWKMREDNGTTYWDTSVDGITYTNRASVANPITLRALTAQLAGVCFQNETNPGTFQWIGFNVQAASLFTVALTGVLSFTGNMTRFTTKTAFTAVLSFTGAFVKRTNKVLTGGLSFTGAFVKQVNKVLTGGLSFTGAFSRAIKHGLTGTLSFTGAMTKSIVKTPFTATLSFTGAFVKQTNKVLTGGLSFTGAFSRKVNKVLSGGLSFTGALSRALAKTAFAAVLSFTGAMTKRTNKTLTGGLSFSGNLVGRANKALTAVLSFTGSMNRAVVHSLTGALSFSGSFLKAFPKSLSGSLSFSGSISRQIGKNLTSTLSFSGNLASFIAPHYVVIKTIITTGIKTFTDFTGSKLANISSSDKLNTVDTGTKNDQISSTDKDQTITSGKDKS